MRYFVILFFILFVNSYSQVVINKFPLDNQLYKRNTTTNSSNILIDGEIEVISGYNSLKLKTFKNGNLISNQIISLNYQNGIAQFSFNFEIISELSTYEFQLVSDSNIILADANNVVCGDVYIISGQSNAAYHRYYPNSFPFSNEFVRSYVNNSWTTNPNPLTFGGIGFSFANEIVSQNNIPVAIFNGSAPGQPISFFQRNDSNYYDNSTNYGQLLSRFTEAGFNSDDANAYIWYQGESNGTLLTTITDYYNSFLELYNDIENDINPNMYYLFQVHSGCGISQVSGIPEAQRLLDINFQDITVISTNGIQQGIDNCHYYNTSGYFDLAQRLFNLVNKDFYNSSITNNIHSPNIFNVKFMNSQKDVIGFELSPITDTFFWEEGAHNDFWIENSSVEIIDGSVINNQVVLALSESILDFNPRLSYLGRTYAVSPYIKNQADVGMLNFKNVTIAENDNSFTKIDDGYWSYYYKNGNLLNPVIAIEHIPNLGSGKNTVNFNLTNIDVVNFGKIIDKVNPIYKVGVFNLPYYWNLNIDNMLNGWINIKLFYPNVLESNLLNSANNFKNQYQSDFISNVLYVKSNQRINPNKQLSFNGFNLPIYKMGNSFANGSYNGNEYLQINQVQFSSSNEIGLTALVKVDNIQETSVEKGTIVFDKVLNKFKGWNGVQWVDFN